MSIEIVMPTNRSLDSQQVEILGRNLLKASLIEAGIEVATPERDNGIDLIAYRWNPKGVFTAYPIQMKAASEFSFGIERKYEKIPHLIMAYVVCCRSVAESVIYAMSYAQMVDVGEAMAWTKTASWTERGCYSTRHLSPKLSGLITPYRIDAESGWKSLLTDR